MKRAFTLSLILALILMGHPARAEVQKSLDYTFEDGVRIKVHYTDKVLHMNGETPAFARDVLNAAVSAYQSIAHFQGFSSKGFSFAKPDKKYAYDTDRTIDVYVGHPDDPESARLYGVAADLFKDAPCFDTRRVSKHGYEAMIFLPANYKEFIRHWERMNPSPLGARHLEVDLHGTLIHEMLHVVLFYYNKNLNKDSRGTGPAHMDWYVEGLARYFETFAGARHDFFSQGFKVTLPDKIRFSRGGANYFMRYPDQSFMELRYENALFWRFLDYRYGMASIEALSRRFRDPSFNNFARSIKKVTGVPIETLLKEYALSILLKDFGLKMDGAYLMDVARTVLIHREGHFYLPGAGREDMLLGEGSRTDWIGRWDEVKAEHDAPSVAGDSTSSSDVSGWATDYCEIRPDAARSTLPGGIGVAHRGGKKPLALQAVLFTKGGSRITLDLGKIKPQGVRWLEIGRTLSEHSLGQKDIENITLLITNLDPRVTAEYEILSRPLST